MASAPATAQEWHKRSTTADARLRRKEARSAVPTPEEVVVIAFAATLRRFWTAASMASSPLHAVRLTPRLTISSGWSLRRHDISRLRSVEGDKPKK